MPLPPGYTPYPYRGSVPPPDQLAPPDTGATPTLMTSSPYSDEVPYPPRQLGAGIDPYGASPYGIYSPSATASSVMPTRAMEFEYNEAIRNGNMDRVKEMLAEADKQAQEKRRSEAIDKALNLAITGGLSIAATPPGTYGAAIPQIARGLMQGINYGMATDQQASLDEYRQNLQATSRAKIANDIERLAQNRAKAETDGTYKPVDAPPELGGGQVMVKFGRNGRKEVQTWPDGSPIRPGKTPMMLPTTDGFVRVDVQAPTDEQAKPVTMGGSPLYPATSNPYPQLVVDEMGRRVVVRPGGSDGAATTTERIDVGAPTSEANRPVSLADRQSAARDALTLAPFILYGDPERLAAFKAKLNDEKLTRGDLRVEMENLAKAEEAKRKESYRTDLQIRKALEALRQGPPPDLTITYADAPASSNAPTGKPAPSGTSTPATPQPSPSPSGAPQATTGPDAAMEAKANEMVTFVGDLRKQYPKMPDDEFVSLAARSLARKYPNEFPTEQDALKFLTPPE